MTPAQRLARARQLVDEAPDGTGGIWARSATLLARQALEDALTELLLVDHPGMRGVNTTTKWICLRHILDDPDLARRAAWTWSALSAATHHHAYALPPTQGELRSWLDVTGELVARVP